MTALRHPNPLSVAEYLAGEEVGGVKHEYLGGVVYALVGASIRHNHVSGNIFAAFHRQLFGKKCTPFNSDMKVRVQVRDHIRFYYPDAMIACQAAPLHQQFHDQPRVIVEVLSESTRRVDLEEKREAYLTIPSLKVLLFCECQSPEVLLFRRNTEGLFQRETFTGLECAIALPEVEVTLVMAELFDRVEFAVA